MHKTSRKKYHFNLKEKECAYEYKSHISDSFSIILKDVFHFVFVKKMCLLFKVPLYKVGAIIVGGGVM